MCGDKNMELKNRFIHHFKHALCIKLVLYFYLLPTQRIAKYKNASNLLHSYLIQERNPATLVTKSSWRYDLDR